MKRWGVWKRQKGIQITWRMIGCGFEEILQVLVLNFGDLDFKESQKRQNESFFCCCGGLKEKKISWLFVGLLMMIHNIYRIR